MPFIIYFEHVFSAAEVPLDSQCDLPFACLVSEGRRCVPDFRLVLLLVNGDDCVHKLACYFDVDLFITVEHSKVRLLQVAYLIYSIQDLFAVTTIILILAVVL